MLRPCLLVLALLACALAGCTAGGRSVLDPRESPPDRSNGQPRVWPCMIGDVLCQPKP